LATCHRQAQLCKDDANTLPGNTPGLAPRGMTRQNKQASLEMSTVTCFHRLHGRLPIKVFLVSHSA